MKYCRLRISDDENFAYDNPPTAWITEEASIY